MTQDQLRARAVRLLTSLMAWNDELQAATDADLKTAMGALQAAYDKGAEDSRPQFPYSGSPEAWAAEALAKYGMGAEAWLTRWAGNYSGDTKTLAALSAAKVLVRTIQSAQPEATKVQR